MVGKVCLPSNEDRDGGQISLIIKILALFSVIDNAIFTKLSIFWIFPA